MLTFFIGLEIDARTPEIPATPAMKMVVIATIEKNMTFFLKLVYHFTETLPRDREVKGVYYKRGQMVLKSAVVINGMLS